MIIHQVPLPVVWELREEVMYPGAGLEMVKLEGDNDGWHLGLYEEDVLVSVISVFVTEGELQFRKFATRVDYQGKGYGTVLLQYVMDWAKKNRCRKVWCNARTTATGIYKKFGMVEAGERWWKHGIEFIKMQIEFEYGDYSRY